MSNRGTFVDERDGQVYKYITIGDKIWMDQNLNYASESSVCYDELQSNCDIYGRLYSVQFINELEPNYGKIDYEILDSLCPREWRVPKLSEWNEVVYQMNGIKYFQKGECMDVSLFSGRGSFEFNIRTGKITKYIFRDLNGIEQIWITQTSSDYGEMVFFSPNYEEWNNDTPKGFFSLRCIKKESWEI